jgi:hypothetical protein
MLASASALVSAVGPIGARHQYDHRLDPIRALTAWQGSTPVAWALRQSAARWLFQRLDQEEDFGGHRVVQLRGVGEGAVAAAGDDGLEGLEEGAERGSFGAGGESREE